MCFLDNKNIRNIRLRMCLLDNNNIRNIRLRTQGKIKNMFFCSYYLNKFLCSSDLII